MELLSQNRNQWRAYVGRAKGIHPCSVSGADEYGFGVKSVADEYGFGVVRFGVTLIRVDRYGLSLKLTNQINA